MSRTWPLAAVALLVLAACGGEKTSSNKNKPIASFTASPTAARPQVFKLDATQSVATVGNIAKYQWTFGDENGAAAKETSVPAEVNAYAAAGTYTITLIVSDDLGTQSEPVTQSITVASVNTDPPKAIISGPDSGAPSEQLSFDGSPSTPAADIQKYAWDFGDPASGALNSSDKPSATHTFVNAGSYRVKLTVTDSLGQSDTAELLVGIGQGGPLAVCSFTPTAPTQGSAVSFDGSASSSTNGATIKTYIWDFDDGSQGTGATAKHTYNVQATFHPKLQVIDTQNRVAETTCADVVVGAPSLCVSDYAMSASPDAQPCSVFGTTKWGGVQLHILEVADGTITGTETFNNQNIVYSGTWSGSTFTMTGTYSQSDQTGGTTTTQATISGTFTGCGSWTATWVEDISYSGLGNLCTLTWNVTGTQL